MYPAEGYKENGIVWKLNKTLYGLRQSPRLFNQLMTETLSQLDLIQSKSYPCLFYN